MNTINTPPSKINNLKFGLIGITLGLIALFLAIWPIWIAPKLGYYDAYMPNKMNAIMTIAAFLFGFLTIIAAIIAVIAKERKDLALIALILGFSPILIEVAVMIFFTIIALVIIMLLLNALGISVI